MTERLDELRAKLVKMEAATECDALLRDALLAVMAELKRLDAFVAPVHAGTVVANLREKLSKK